METRVLSGFTDDGHFRAFIQEYLNSLNPDDQKTLLAEAERTREVARSLPVAPLDDVFLRPLTGEHVDKIASDPTFQDAFRNSAHRFVWINPAHVIAIQVFVKPRADEVPKSERELLDFALPTKWDVPAELSFIPPTGPIQIVTSSPHLAGLRARLDSAAGRIIIEPPPHLNLLQVMHYNGRYYLRNGYHRMYDILSAGVTEAPALLVEAVEPAGVELANLGMAGFNAGYTMGLLRPPFVSDFLLDAALNTRVRLRRYGVSVTLQITPLNIGI